MEERKRNTKTWRDNERERRRKKKKKREIRESLWKKERVRRRQGEIER